MKSTCVLIVSLLIYCIEDYKNNHKYYETNNYKNNHKSYKKSLIIKQIIPKKNKSTNKWIKLVYLWTKKNREDEKMKSLIKLVNSTSNGLNF